MSKSNGLCGACGEGRLYPEVDKDLVEYNGQTANLDLHFSRCDTCGSELAGADQSRLNKRLMIAFRKQVDGLLSGAEVRAIRKRLGLSQKEAAHVFGGGPVAFSKYESDDVVQSDAMDKLLRLADQFPATFNALCDQAGIGSVALDTQVNVARMASTAASANYEKPTIGG